MSYVEGRVRARDAARQANRFAIRDAIMGAETALNELRAQVRSLEIVFAAGTQTPGASDSINAIAQFGRVSLTFTLGGHERWREIDNDILTSASRLQRHMSDLMRHFASANLRLRGHTAQQVHAAIEALNNAMRTIGQVHFGELFRVLEEIIGLCANVMRDLRQELDEWLPDRRPRQTGWGGRSFIQCRRRHARLGGSGTI
jgi:hypothetical protein